jgi:hypothetical protein
MLQPACPALPLQAIAAGVAQLLTIDVQQPRLVLRSRLASGRDGSQLWPAMELLGTSGLHLQGLAGAGLACALACAACTHLRVCSGQLPADADIGCRSTAAGAAGVAIVLP